MDQYQTCRLLTMQRINLSSCRLQLGSTEESSNGKCQVPASFFPARPYRHGVPLLLNIRNPMVEHAARLVWPAPDTPVRATTGSSAGWTEPHSGRTRSEAGSTPTWSTASSVAALDDFPWPPCTGWRRDGGRGCEGESGRARPRRQRHAEQYQYYARGSAAAPRLAPPSRSHAHGFTRRGRGLHVETGGRSARASFPSSCRGARRIMSRTPELKTHTGIC